MTDGDDRATRFPKWGLLLVIGAVSLVTMSLTAVLFLFLGLVIVFSTPIIVAGRPAAVRTAQLSTGTSVGLGLLVGPAVYLGLAAFT